MSNTVIESPADETTTIGEKLSNTATQVKDKVTEFGRSAVERIDGNRDAAAGGLDKAASALHDKADSLSSTAVYLRDTNVNRMMGDMEMVVKNNPGPSLVAAVVVGFLVGKAFSSSD